jgi:hypothetical protein
MDGSGFFANLVAISYVILKGGMINFDVSFWFSFRVGVLGFGYLPDCRYVLRVRKLLPPTRQRPLTTGSKVHTSAVSTSSGDL